MSSVTLLQIKALRPAVATIVFVVTVVLFYVTPVVVQQVEAQVAFPGALGFGANTTGARGQGTEVCRVTNVNDSGSGSFRACAEKTTPAYIVFQVSGYIDLSDEVHIESNKTIECATAPGDGVVFRQARLHVLGNNVILRGCRSWPGDSVDGQDLSSRDGITVGNTSSSIVTDVIVANNSLLWSTDELGGSWYPVDRVTFQENIFAWALKTAGHEQITHSMGHLIGDNAQTVSSLRNYMAFNEFRNPLVKKTVHPVEIVNNLVYCSGNRGTDISNSKKVHIIGNRYRVCSQPDRTIMLSASSSAYVSDNTTSDNQATIINFTSTSRISPTIHFTPTFTAMPSSAVQAYVFEHVGPPRRLAIEQTALNHYLTGTGKIIDSQSQVGGYPTLRQGTPWTDSDNDGMPDSWEQSHCGGNCTPNGDVNNNGYANIEEWFHSFYINQTNQVTADVSATTPTIPLDATPCGDYESPNTPNGYGSAFSHFSSERELILEGDCGDAGFTPYAGSFLTDQTNFAVYNQGYYWSGTAWRPFTFTPITGLSRTSTDSTAWILGPAVAAQIPYQAATTYFVAYTCHFGPGQTPKCGCSDSTCATPKWQVQKVTRP